MLPTIPVSRTIRSPEARAGGGDHRRPLALAAAGVCAVLGLFTTLAVSAAGAGRVDLARDASRARTLAVPVVIVMSRTDCGHCRWLRENVLVPSTFDPGFAGRAVIRELFIDSGDTLIDFDGVERAAALIARRYDASFTPTVLFLDDRGEQLVTAIRGIASRDFYAYYFDESIDRAGLMLRGRR